MKAFITPAGFYYQGDQAAPEDVEVLPRPDHLHDYVAGAWVLNQARKNDFDNETTKASLAAIDALSVRAMREFIALKFANDPQLPAQLVTHETSAQVERAKLK